MEHRDPQIFSVLIMKDDKIVNTSSSKGTNVFKLKDVVFSRGDYTMLVYPLWRPETEEVAKLLTVEIVGNECNGFDGIQHEVGM